jgi:DNA-binding response OmpR family regulator
MTRFLVVDDEETIRFALARYFTRLGFEVDCASELEEAEALVANTRYDLVIADLSLTGGGSGEGLEILRFLRANCPSTHVILLTAYGTPVAEREAMRRGAEVVLHKPQPLEELARIANRLLGRSA